MTTNLTDLAKSDLNALLAEPLAASFLAGTGLPDRLRAPTMIQGGLKMRQGAPGLMDRMQALTRSIKPLVYLHPQNLLAGFCRLTQRRMAGFR
jgi:hypothetical protein